MPGADENVLIIKLGALGDVLQSFGPMAAIRAHHPNARITVLTTAPYRDLIGASGYADDIILDTKPRWHDLKGWLDLRRKLNAGKFGRVYDLQNNDRTAFYLRLLSPRPEWVGAAYGASHRNASPQRTQGKAFDGHVQTLALAGIKNVRVDTLGWMDGSADYEGLRAPYILIAAGSSPAHPEKRWPHYADLCRTLLRENYLPVLLGADADANDAAAIEQSAPGVLNLIGKTGLFDIAALARGAAGAVGNDTGPMHIIAPTGCPSIVLFSKDTNPKKHAPLGRDVITIQKNDLKDLDADAVWRAFAAQHTSP